jgi:hypothetical protein
MTKLKKVGLWTGGILLLSLIGSIVTPPEKEENKQPIKKEVVKSPKVIKVVTEKNTLKGGYGACISEDYFDQFAMAYVNKDNNGVNYLLKNEKCIITKSGLKFSLLDRSFTGTAKIRVYVGNDAFILWTYNENLNL